VLRSPNLCWESLPRIRRELGRAALAVRSSELQIDWLLGRVVESKSLFIIIMASYTFTCVYDGLGIIDGEEYAMLRKIGAKREKAAVYDRMQPVVMLRSAVNECDTHID